MHEKMFAKYSLTNCINGSQSRIQQWVVIGVFETGEVE